MWRAAARTARAVGFTALVQAALWVAPGALQAQSALEPLAIRGVSVRVETNRQVGGGLIEDSGTSSATVRDDFMFTVPSGVPPGTVTGSYELTAIVAADRLVLAGTLTWDVVSPLMTTGRNFSGMATYEIEFDVPNLGAPLTAVVAHTPAVNITTTDVNQTSPLAASIDGAFSTSLSSPFSVLVAANLLQASVMPLLAADTVRLLFDVRPPTLQTGSVAGTASFDVEIHFSASATPAGADPDGDGVVSLDNCPTVPNPGQEPSALFATVGRDCVSGDVTRDGLINVSDAIDIQNLVALPPLPLDFPASDINFCDVTGAADGSVCNLTDALTITDAAAVPPIASALPYDPTACLGYTIGPPLP